MTIRSQLSLILGLIRPEPPKLFALELKKNFFPKLSRVVTNVKQPFQNIVGKGENAGDQHFLLLPQFFVPFQNQVSFF